MIKLIVSYVWSCDQTDNHFVFAELSASIY